MKGGEDMEQIKEAVGLMYVAHLLAEVFTG